MRMAWLAVVAVLSLSGAAEADPVAEAIATFDIDKTPADQRGQDVPIAGNAAYGHRYVHDQGWFTFVYPANAKSQRDEYKGTVSRMIRFSTGAVNTFCLATTYRASRTQTFAQLQADGASLLGPATEKLFGLKSDEVVDRRILKLGDGGYPKRKPVEAATWETASTDYRGVRTARVLAVVYVPLGAVFVTCSAETGAKARLILEHGLRVGEGALGSSR